MVFASIVEPEHRNARPNHIHRPRVLRRVLQKFDHAVRQRALTAQRARQIVQLGLSRQFSAMQKVDDLLKRGVLDQRWT